MTRRNRRGTTVLEALIAVCIGSMLLCVVLALVSFSTKSFGRTQQRLDPREQASRIMTALRRHLTDSRHYKIEQDGRLIRFQTPREVAHVAFNEYSKSIEIVSDNEIGVAPEVVSGGVQAFSVHQVRRGVVRVSLTVERPVVYDGLASLGPLAMVDEIHVPAAARQRRIPWNRVNDDRPPRAGNLPI